MTGKLVNPLMILAMGAVADERHKISEELHLVSGNFVSID